MKSLLLIFLLIPFPGTAQEKGIHFEHWMTWKEVQAKAKMEQKYIFVDCFTTWCAPCRFMSQEIFPLKEVGDFINPSFVSLQVQLDTTDYDNVDIKKRYADAHAMMQKCMIVSFAAYLFFDYDGHFIV